MVNCIPEGNFNKPSFKKEILLYLTAFQVHFLAEEFKEIDFHDIPRDIIQNSHHVHSLQRPLDSGGGPEMDLVSSKSVFSLDSDPVFAFRVDCGEDSGVDLAVDSYLQGDLDSGVL